MNKKLWILMGIILAIIIIISFYYFFSENKQFPTYFSYQPEALKAASRLDSNQQISKEDLAKWDSIMFDLVKENKLGDAPASRIYAYLYVGQYDFASLSYNLKHQFAGNIDVLSAKILCLFFEKNCKEIGSHVNNNDEYSNALATIVINQIKNRIDLDNAQTKNYPEKRGAQYWAGTHPYFGQDVGSWKPWTLQSSNQFRAPTPPAPKNTEWQKQLQMTKTALANITGEQKKAVIFWAGNPGTVTPPGQWLIDANDYMWSNNISLSKIFLVRAVLAIGIADSVIAVFDSKYSYWIKRPNMLDNSIHTIMPTPNHPSYPAGHASISSAAATILIHYFPESTSTWKKREYEASHSRVWGGIHFTIDSDAGNHLGEQVGNVALQKL